MCADIHDGREQKRLPSKGRIQMSQTNYLQIAISRLQRTAGPYRSAIALALTADPPPSCEVSRSEKRGSSRVARKQISVTDPAGLAMLAVPFALGDQVPQVRHRHVRAVHSQQRFLSVLAFPVATRADHPHHCFRILPERH